MAANARYRLAGRGVDRHVSADANGEGTINLEVDGRLDLHLARADGA
jgi:hypothetical protein